MFCLDTLRQVYMLVALNIREACSKQSKQKYDDIPNCKIVGLIMIKNFDQNSNWDAKHIPNFRVVHLIVQDNWNSPIAMGRIRNVNVCDVHKMFPLDHIVSLILDEQVFGRRGKYINDPQILKELATIHAFLHENSPHVKIKQK